MPAPDHAIADTPIPRQTRAFIVLVALLQGGLLYLAAWGESQHLGPFRSLGGQICWYTLVLSVPSAALLCVQQLGDRRLWQHLAIVAAVFAALAAWAAWSATGAPGLQSRKILTPFGLSVSAGLFVALPWLQSRQQSGRWRADYRALFEHAWQNALTLALALLFVLVCWTVLQLWAALFALIKIEIFRTLFRGQAFIYLATGIMTGLGILIGRTQHRAVQVLRQILFAICTGLLPLLAGVALLFVLTLPLTGLQALWQTRSAATLLLSVVFLLVLFTNAVYQDGRVTPSYPRWLRRLVDASLLSLPLYAGLAAYALGLRIAQYGWTGERFCASVLALVALGYALGGAWAVLRPQPGRWLGRMAGSNVAMSWLLIALVVAVNSPVLDPYRLVVGSQLQQWVAQRGPTVSDSEQQDLEFLRFDNGRRGYRAVAALLTDPALSADGRRRELVKRLLARTERWEAPPSSDALQKTRMTDPAELRKHLLLAVGSASPDASWWSALAAGKLDNDSCLQRDTECVVNSLDLDQDGNNEVLLCEVSSPFGVLCTLYANDARGWSKVDSAHSYPRRSQGQEALRDAVRKGKFTLQPRRWPDIHVPGGGPLVMDPPNNQNQPEK
ncbi:DUF4153 domain-containing protein [Xanthomonas maliensis]|uniref:DUF4153 domain-containing protein n=1 Tax=Xanthomonas maliensis TaxID=1321368 RepID=UPI0003A34001|nr:DUF4153 domain-containing protein [Xanthomonas maliensis]KAB7771994.1 DUF4153 domain-containing protein [Xanthomonas maliensis]